MSVTAIQSEVLNLSAADRARLLDLIWDSLSEPETKAREAASAAESERRIDAYDSGKLTARPAADVFTDLKEKFTEVKAHFTSIAELELKEAMEFYESKQAGFGAEFLAEVEATTQLIEVHPQAWLALSPRTRRCRTHRFPYGLFYQIRETEILIVTVMDLRRDPRRWESYL